jgi:hypothetical protein
LERYKMSKGQVNFIAITGVGKELYGLDEHGRVWRYCSAVKGRHHAFWTRLTSFGINSDAVKEVETDRV